MNFSAQASSSELLITINDVEVTSQHNPKKILDYVKEHNRSCIIIDLANVQTAGSTLISTLIAIKRLTNSNVVIRNASTDVLVLLDIVGLNHLLKATNGNNKTQTPMYNSAG